MKAFVLLAVLFVQAVFCQEDNEHVLSNGQSFEGGISVITDDNVNEVPEIQIGVPFPSWDPSVTAGTDGQAEGESQSEGFVGFRPQFSGQGPRPRPSGEGQGPRPRPSGEGQGPRPRPSGEGQGPRPRPSGEGQGPRPRPSGEGQGPRPRPSGEGQGPRPRPGGESSMSPSQGGQRPQRPQEISEEEQSSSQQQFSVQFES